MSQSRPFTCIGVGAPIMDSLAQVPETFLAQIGGAKGGMEYIEAERMSQLLQDLSGKLTEVPGGSAANTTQALARLGLPVTFLGKIGNDSRADLYRKNFQESGGDITKFKQGQLPHAGCLSLVTPDSQRTMRTYLGAAVTLSPSEISVADFQDCRHAHLEGYLLFNPELATHILKCAHQAGCSVSLDLASFEVVHAAKPILQDLLRQYVDVVFSNEDEAKAFTGQTTDFQKMSLELAEYCSIAVVKIGKEGSYIASGKSVTTIQPVPVPQALDTTGAGDAWAAGFLYGWLSGKSLAESGAWGSLLGAEVVQVLGPRIPSHRWQAILK
jgi:sugar/nucleoside kinase (ribokinase family)